MFVSDIFIGFYTWQTMASVYLSFVLAGLIGMLIRKNKKAATVIGGTILGSIFVFPNHKLCCLGIWQYVYAQFRWFDAVLHHGDSIFQKYASWRFILYRRACRLS